MVHDTWDYVQPTGDPSGRVYVLDVWDNDEIMLSSCVSMLGVYEHLETALHAMDHIRLFEFRDIEVGQSLLVTSIKANKRRQEQERAQLVSWRRGPDDPNNHGCSTGTFNLHPGLKTHVI